MKRARRLPVLAACLTCTLAAPALPLDNGVAKKPPMGVNGMKEAGYIYINQDCGTWYYNNMEPDGEARRDEDGVLVVHEFIPDGIPHVADHIHALGLKIGLYVMPELADETAERGTIGRDFKAFANHPITLFEDDLPPLSE